MQLDTDSETEQYSESEQTQPLDKPATAKLTTMTAFFKWPSIKTTLTNMAHQKYNQQQIIDTLRQFKIDSMQDRRNCSRYPPAKDFHMEALQALFRNQLVQIYSQIAGFALSHTGNEYPLFLKQQAKEHTFSQTAILFLMCSMALFLLPKQVHFQNNQGFKLLHYDFFIIFQRSQFKTKCIVEYLKKQLSFQHPKKKGQVRNLTIRRQVTHQTIEELIGKHHSTRMCPFIMNIDSQNIEDHLDSIKVDFANQFIGGGALTNGCVQEEIMFSNHPELFVTMLLCECMEKNEALQMIGFRKYNCNKGYGMETVYNGPELHQYGIDSFGRVKDFITAVDASVMHKRSGQQFSRDVIKREILKAYTGFCLQTEETNQIITGNWGCGAFEGDTRVKLLIQWLACSLAEKELVYCPFGQKDKVEDKHLFNQLAQLRVGQVYKLLLQASKQCMKQLRSKAPSTINIYLPLAGLLPSSQGKS